MNYVRVVPVLRTPIGIDAFDYATPEGLTCEIGDLVWVMFRRRKTPALIVERMRTSRFADRVQNVIEPYADLRLPEASVRLLGWLSDWTFTSKSAVALSWFRTLPKRPARIGNRTKSNAKGEMRAHWLTDPDRELIEAAKNTKGRTLVLTPWVASAKRLAKEIPGSTLLLSEQADGAYFKQWTTWLANEKTVIISTRIGAWLSPMADEVFLHLPEQDDHKQDELSPRYDARRMAAWSAQHAGTRVRAFGVTPPLQSEEAAPNIFMANHVVIRNPRGYSPIPMIQADVLNTIRDHEGPRVLIHPVRGISAKFVCRDCGWQATCERCGFAVSQNIDRAICRRCGWTGAPPLSCASCSGTDLGKSIPGIERLKSAWAKFEPETEAEWRTMAVEEYEAPLPANALIVVTDASCLSGAVEDIRRDERLVVAIRHLASRVLAVAGILVLQTDEHLASLVATCVTSDGYLAHRERERSLRQEFGYPPSVRLVKFIVEGTTENAEAFKNRLDSTVPDVRGPYSVAFRPKSRKSRWIIHAVFPKNIDQRELAHTLKPFRSDAIIDLDPIAFFR